MTKKKTKTPLVTKFQKWLVDESACSSGRVDVEGLNFDETWRQFPHYRDWLCNHLRVDVSSHALMPAYVHLAAYNQGFMATKPVTNIVTITFETCRAVDTLETKNNITDWINDATSIKVVVKKGVNS